MKSHIDPERRPIEGLDEHCGVHPLEEKLDGRVVLVAGKQCGAHSGNIRLVVAEIVLTAPRLRAAVRKISLFSIKCADATSFPFTQTRLL
jgi:hypothetical protein